MEEGADYILPVKENQPKLLEAIESIFEAKKDTCTDSNYAKTIEKSHGRYEKRESYVINNLDQLKQQKEWKNLSGVGMIVNQREIIGANNIEKDIHYVIFSKKDTTAAELLESKRAHWGVENSLHWVLDINFREDESRARRGNSAKNLNIMRHLAINLINNEKTSKGGVNLKRKRCMLSKNYLLKVIGFS